MDFFTCPSCHSVKIDPSCPTCRRNGYFQALPNQIRIDRMERFQHIMQLELRVDPSITVTLIGMPRTMRRGPDEARSLCAGVVFQACYENAITSGDDVWLLSPRHGLLSPDVVIYGESLCLNELTRRSQIDWARDVISDLVEHYHQRHLDVHLLADQSYSRLFREVLEHTPLTWQWVEPLRGMGMDEKLRMLDVSRDGC